MSSTSSRSWIDAGPKRLLLVEELSKVEMRYYYSGFPIFFEAFNHKWNIGCEFFSNYHYNFTPIAYFVNCIGFAVLLLKERLWLNNSRNKMPVKHDCGSPRLVQEIRHIKRPSSIIYEPISQLHTWRRYYAYILTSLETVEDLTGRNFRTWRYARV